MLDRFSDGFGAWKFTDVLGKPLAELPEALIDDLMTLRYLAQIAENEQEKANEKPAAKR